MNTLIFSDTHVSVADKKNRASLFSLLILGLLLLAGGVSSRACSINIASNVTSVVEGSPVIFTGTITHAYRDVNYEWRKNGLPMTDSGASGVAPLSGTGIFTFATANLNSGDVITCFVQEGSYRGISPGITITVLPNWKLTQPFSHTITGALAETVEEDVPGTLAVKARAMPQESITNISVFPNPAVSNPNIAFHASANGSATITIFNAVTGTKVADIFSQPIIAGVDYSVPFNTRDIAAGLYIARIATNTSTQNIKLLLVK